LDAAEPVVRAQHVGEELALRDERGTVQLLAARAASAVLERERAGGVVEDLDRQAAMGRLPRGRVDAHVRHVARDGDGVDARVGEHVAELGVRERAGQRLVDQEVARPALDLGMQLPRVRVPEEDALGSVIRAVTHDDHGHAGSARRLHRAPDVRKALLARRIRDRQRAVEVLVLDVDHDQCALGHLAAPSVWSPDSTGPS